MMIIMVMIFKLSSFNQTKKKKFFSPTNWSNILNNNDEMFYYGLAVYDDDGQFPLSPNSIDEYFSLIVNKV